MDGKQRSQKEMIDASLHFMDTNAQVWNAIPKIGQFKNELSATNQAIDSVVAMQMNAQVSIGKNKSILKKNIATKADILNDIIECYASIEDLPELESRMSVSYSGLFKTKEAEFGIKVKEIITEAENHAGVLKGEYGMTDQQVVDLKQDIDAYNELRGTPRMYSVASVQATKQLDQLLQEAMSILTDKLDKVMKVFKRRDPHFYNGYLASRVIVD